MANLERARDHLANERTYLAWVRTAVATIVFGFAIGRFGIALRQLAAAQGAPIRTTGLSLWFGTASMLIGVVLMLAAFVRFRRIERDLENGVFQRSDALIKFVAAVVVVFGIALTVYLVFTDFELAW
jgi:putative membrane protein